MSYKCEHKRLNYYQCTIQKHDVNQDSDSLDDIISALRVLKYFCFAYYILYTSEVGVLKQSKHSNVQFQDQS